MILGDEQTKICGSASIKCYRKAKKNLETNAELFREKCNCLPACIFIEYNAEIDHVQFNVESISNIQVGVLSIFYKNHQIEIIKRIELYTVVDFLANCGALLGLCLGISLLSIIEIVYYLTLRLVLTIGCKKSDIGYTVPPRGRVTSTNFKRILRICRSFFVELCDNSNIHGLRYFTKRLVHWTERWDTLYTLIRCFHVNLQQNPFSICNRLWWIVAFGLSLWLCSLLIRRIWIQWQENPVAMSFTEPYMSISDIPFPTVTICPATKALHKHDLNLSLMYFDFRKNISKATWVQYIILNYYPFTFSHKVVVFKRFAITPKKRLSYVDLLFRFFFFFHVQSKCYQIWHVDAFMHGFCRYIFVCNQRCKK